MHSAKSNPMIYENRIRIFKKSVKSSVFSQCGSLRWLQIHMHFSTRPHILILKSGREVYLEPNIILSLEPQAWLMTILSIYMDTFSTYQPAFWWSIRFSTLSSLKARVRSRSRVTFLFSGCLYKMIKKGAAKMRWAGNTCVIISLNLDHCYSLQGIYKMWSFFKVKPFRW